VLKIFNFINPQVLLNPYLSLASKSAYTPSKMSQDAAEQNIQMWKVKKLIKSLDSARGYQLFLAQDLATEGHR
jgi:hypothetical protein